MGFTALGLGFGDWDWKKVVYNGKIKWLLLLLLLLEWARCPIESTDYLKLLLSSLMHKNAL